MKKYLQIFILILLISFFFQKSLQSQWFKLPNLPDSGRVRVMQFVNVNTGWISTSTIYYPPYYTFMKTTDGGQSWNELQNTGQVLKFIFFNDSLGIAIDWLGNNISKTMNGGLNWNTIFATGNVYGDIFFVNKDTGWTCGFDGILGGVWRTNDGGNSWYRQYTSNSNGLERIFFLKNKVNGEYWGWTFKGSFLWRTTNSGLNWAVISDFGVMCQSGYDIYFIDTAKGIITRTADCFSKTTDGGFSWVHQEYYGILYSKIGIGDNNIMWLTLGTSGTLIKTTNFFQTYGKQIVPAGSKVIFAVDTLTVYAGWDQNNMMKTTNGGGPIIYTGIDSLNLSLPSSYKLYQNYPNPFNPVTKINYELPKDSKVTLIIYDITGKEIRRLIDNEFKQAGIYSIDFDEPSLASGVYFYRIETGEFNAVKKMVLIK